MAYFRGFKLLKWEDFHFYNETLQAYLVFSRAFVLLFEQDFPLGEAP